VVPAIMAQMEKQEKMTYFQY